MKKTTRNDIKDRERHFITFNTMDPVQRKAYLYYRNHDHSSKYIANCILIAEEQIKRCTGYDYAKLNLIEKEFMESQLNTNEKILSLLTDIVEGGKLFIGPSVDNSEESEKSETFDTSTLDVRDVLDEFDSFDF